MEVLLLFIGIISGMIVASGIFALINSVKIIPRLAEKTHTANKIRCYENSVIFGGFLANIYYVFSLKLPIGQVSAAIWGLFSGMFVGCLATSLAESLKTTAIYKRRLKNISGVGYIILFTALGKTIGSLLFFYLGWY